jgi:hypothetical protein
MPTHDYAQTGTYSGTLDVWNCQGSEHATMDFVVSCVVEYTIYLPLVMKAHGP